MNKANVLIFPAGGENAINIYDSLKYNLHFELFGATSKKDYSVDLYKKENFYLGDLYINDDTKLVTVDGKEVKLTPTEYNILKFLTKNKGIVYSIEQIYENVWEEESYGAENIIAVHIRHIREKIEINPREPKYLKVIWGVGYKIEKLDEA